MYERELVKLLHLYYPYLDLHKPPKAKPAGPFQKIKTLQKERLPGEEYHDQLKMVCKWLKEHFNPEDEDWCRWGKFHLSNGTTLRSKLSENIGKPSERSCRYFQVLYFVLLILFNTMLIKIDCRLREITHILYMVKL